MNDDPTRNDAGASWEPKSSAPSKPAATKGNRRKKISHNLIVASAAAILTVYVAGYAATQSAAAQIAAQSAPASTTVGSAASAVAPTAASSSPTATSASRTSSTTASASAATSGYKDGTYSGVGTSRHGSIQAQVVVQNGRIVSAQITGASTRYPTSRIASLPGEVVSQQSTNVDYVSGATDSSQAYLDAVSSALAQAA